MLVRELRSFVGLKIRTEQDGDDLVIVGLGVPWDTLPVDLGGFRERFVRGAFGDLEDLDVVSTFEHDNRMLLGRTISESLELEERDEGLVYRVQLPSTRADVAELVNRGDVRGSSFEFIVNEDGDSFDRIGDDVVRTVTSATLFQVGPVTNPAYRDTTVAQRSLELWSQAPERDRLAELEHRQRILELTL